MRVVSFFLAMILAVASSFLFVGRSQAETSNRVQSKGEFIQPFSSRNLVYSTTLSSSTSTTQDPTAAPTSTVPSPQAASRQMSRPIFSWAFILPLASCIMYAFRKHGRRCCAASDVFEEPMIPMEIAIPHKGTTIQDIELQDCPVHKLDIHKQGDPVTGDVGLNTSDWTDDDPNKDYSGNWIENEAGVHYTELKD